VPLTITVALPYSTLVTLPLTRSLSQTHLPWFRDIEVGVGTGKNFPYDPKDSNITGIDIADKMLPLAKKGADGLGGSVRLMEDDVQARSFPDNLFDTAVATFVFCSVPDPVLGLQELRRVVKPSGQILLLEHVRINHPVIIQKLAGEELRPGPHKIQGIGE